MADNFFKSIEDSVDGVFDKLLGSVVKTSAAAAQPQLDESIKKAVDQATTEVKGISNTIIFVIAGMFASVLIFITLKRK